MGSLAGHISAFLFLFPIGIRRLSSILSLHLRSPPPAPPFRARPWYFSDHPNPQIRLLRNADLYALLLSLPVAAFSEIFLFLTLGSPPPHRFPFAHQSAILFLFWLLLLLPVALRHCLDPPASSLLPDDLVFLLAALAFLAEYALSSPGGEVAAGSVDGRVYGIMSAVTLACAGSCLALSVRRSALAADVALSLGLALKGTWALQAGVTLFAAAPRGCGWRGGGGGSGWGPLECELEEDRARGVALVDLLFAGHAVAIAAACVGVHWTLARSASNRTVDLDAMITRPMMMSSSDFEMD